MAGPAPDQTLHGGLMRHVTFFVMAMMKAAATAVIKAKTGVEREATSAAVEVITDMLVDNTSGQKLEEFRRWTGVSHGAQSDSLGQFVVAGDAAGR